MSRVAVIIPAGGKGRRIGGRVPKQFLSILGKPVLSHTIACFEGIREVREIILVVSRAHFRRTTLLVKNGKFRKVTAIVEGGRERQDSVRHGLNACSEDAEIVLVHDAVRPLVSPEIIRRVITASIRFGAAVVGARVRDTIKIESTSRTGFYAKTLPRKLLWGVQTPQGFRIELLKRAHRSAEKSGFLGTDDASLVERLGIPVRIVQGNPENLKITAPFDLLLAEILLSSRRTPRG
jgi:2-C-methyl-D-erythritol 4-phosphate cytidylyltransferase